MELPANATDLKLKNYTYGKGVNSVLRLMKCKKSVRCWFQNKYQCNWKIKHLEMLQGRNVTDLNEEKHKNHWYKIFKEAYSCVKIIVIVTIFLIFFTECKS